MCVALGPQRGVLLWEGVVESGQWDGLSWILARSPRLSAVSFLRGHHESERESHSVVSDSLRPMDCIVHGILRARILECVDFPFSRGSSQPRDWTQVSCIAGRFFTSWATGKPKKTAVGSLALLQQIFLTQESNWGLLHCRWVLYQLSYQMHQTSETKLKLGRTLPWQTESGSVWEEGSWGYVCGARVCWVEWFKRVDRDHDRFR